MLNLQSTFLKANPSYLESDILCEFFTQCKHHKNSQKAIQFLELVSMLTHLNNDQICGIISVFGHLRELTFVINLFNQSKENISQSLFEEKTRIKPSEKKNHPQIRQQQQ